MTIKDDLRGYKPPMAAVERIDGSRITVFLGDEQPPLGSALGFLIDSEPIYGVVERHLGARRAQIWLPFGAENLSTQTPLLFSGKPAGFALPPDRRIDPSTALLRPLKDGDLPLWPSPPSLAELKGHRPPLLLGIEPLDLLAPLCLGGLNLVVDTTDGDAAFEALATKALAAAGPDNLLLPTKFSELAEEKPWLIEPADDSDQQILGLQILLALAEYLRQQGSTLAFVELPTPEEFDPQAQRTGLPGAGLPEIIDRLGRHLVSTKEATMTTILRLRLPATHRALSQIIETLHLGDLDSLIYLTEEGRFDPRRSSSRAELDQRESNKRRQLLQLLSLARQAEDKKAIFGDFEITEEECQALDKAAALYAPIA